MQPFRNLSILALFVLASASAFAATDTLVVNITVTIAGACDIEWTTGELQGPRTWTINPASVNTAYSSALAAFGDIKDSTSANVAVATAFDIINNSTGPILINQLTIVVTGDGNWASVNPIGGHGNPNTDKCLVRFRTDATTTVDTLAANGNSYASEPAPQWTDVPRRLQPAAPINTGGPIAASGTQTLKLEFITPWAVTFNTSTTVVTITATI
jgi:hypothetical protein